jgi:16S rRNA (cytosine1402-N4)-methyltransferase
MHIPVLLRETLEYLDLKNGDFIIDGTINGGGHAKEILNKIGSRGLLLGVDWDSERILELEKKPEFSKKNFIGVHANYAEIPKILEEKKLPKADGLFLDLGFSSEQLAPIDAPGLDERGRAGANGERTDGRGFSFLRDEPLLMTYDKSTQPAYEVIAALSEKELADVIFHYGEERYSRRVARAIKEHRGVRRSGELAEIIVKSLPRGYERGRIHPATRTFQAIRIYVNDELGNLKKILESLPSVLKSDGRVVVISFHSLEDRIVKQAFRAMQKDSILEIITKKPVMATEGEIKANPRSRSAKLRAAKIV